MNIRSYETLPSDQFKTLELSIQLRLLLHNKLRNELHHKLRQPTFNGVEQRLTMVTQEPSLQLRTWMTNLPAEVMTSI